MNATIICPCGERLESWDAMAGLPLGMFQCTECGKLWRIKRINGNAYAQDVERRFIHREAQLPIRGVRANCNSAAIRRAEGF